jgi:hypothetical protein
MLNGTALARQDKLRSLRIHHRLRVVALLEAGAVHRLPTAPNGEDVMIVKRDEPRYDTGDRLGFLQATVQLAAARDDVGPEFVAWLRKWLEEQK